MSTVTCSTFLPRNCLVSYLSGKYLLAANGPFIELYDMQKRRTGEYCIDKDNPIKTKVTKNDTILHIIPLNKCGHIVVISSTTRNDYRILTAQIVHSDLIQTGGYAMDPSASFILSKELYVVCSETRAEAIPGEDEFVLATSQSISRFRIAFSSNNGFIDAEIFREEEYDLRAIASGQPSADFLLAPSCISPSLPLNFILKAHNDSHHSLIYVQASNSSLECLQFRNDDVTKVHIILPRLELLILCGDEFISVLSTRLHRQKEAKQNLGLIARARNPFSSPMKIIAKENTEERTAMIFIISVQGTSIWKCTDKEISMQDAIEEYAMNGLRESNINEVKDSNLRSLLSARVEFLNHMDEFLDANIMQTKDESNVWELVFSRKAGFLEVIRVNNNEGTSSIGILTRASTLSCCPKMSLKKSKHLYIFSNNLLSDSPSAVVSINSVAIECMTLNKKGKLRAISKGESGEVILPILKATCCDVKYAQNDNTASILIGGQSGEIHLRVLDKLEKLEFDGILHTENSEILSILHFHDNFTSNSLDCYSVLTASSLRVYRLNFKKEPTLVKNLHELKQIRLKDYKMLTMGDGGIVHDVWLISDERVHLFIGRNQEYGKKAVELRFNDWEGRIAAMCCISTRKKLHESEYIDVVTVAKGKRIGVLVALQMDEYPADVIEFVEWIMPPGSKTVGIHTELLKCERDSSGNHVLDIRLYAMKRSGTLHISIARLLVGEKGVIVSKSLLNMCKIATSVVRPFQIAVSGPSLLIDQKINEEPPKFVIVSGSNGSQVVRVCPKMQLYSHSLDHTVFPSTFDTDLISEDED